MENVSNHTQLALRIKQLKAKKFIQEEELKVAIKEFVNTLSPLSMVKDSLHKLATDNEVKTDLATVGLKLGANLLIDTVLGKRSGIKGFLSSLLVENVAGSYINNNSSKIISTISQLLNKV
ncbi:MAG: hypothetical protein H0W61_02515 [Bacteroidetes bacterium]|nr:hypothetical protein [Bacteroidota bacterium]